MLLLFTYRAASAAGHQTVFSVYIVRFIAMIWCVALSLVFKHYDGHNVQRFHQLCSRNWTLTAAYCWTADQMVQLSLTYNITVITYSVIDSDSLRLLAF